MRRELLDDAVPVADLAEVQAAPAASRPTRHRQSRVDRAVSRNGYVSFGRKVPGHRAGGHNDAALESEDRWLPRNDRWRMTYFEAALQVLKSSREPLTAREITERAIERGLIVPRGKTPDATMRATLYVWLGTDAQLVKTKARDLSSSKPSTVRWALCERPDDSR